MGTPAVDIEEVTHRYGTHEALDAVSLQVAPGGLYGVLGPNGSGKTTLFRILSTLLPPSTGRASVFGHSVTSEPAAVRRRLGIVFQDTALDDSLTVSENLRFQAALYGVHGQKRRGRIDELLGRMDLTDRRDDVVAELSGGLQRRVDLARGILHRPDLLLLDEPTTGLDPAARRAFWSAINGLRESEGTTLLLATHLMDEAERCDRVGILSDGALVADGSPRALKADLGEETLWLESDAPRALRDRIDAHFGESGRIVGSMVQVAPSDPPGFLSGLYEVLGDRIRSATIRTPTLEDVFMVHAEVAPDADESDLLSGAAVLNQEA